MVVIAFVYWLIWSLRDLTVYFAIPDSGEAFRFTLLVGPCAALAAMAAKAASGSFSFRLPRKAKWILLYTAWCGASLGWTHSGKLIDAVCIFVSLVGDLIAVAVIMSIPSERRPAFRATCWALVVAAIVMAVFVIANADPTAAARVGEGSGRISPTYLGGRIAFGALACLNLAVHSSKLTRRALFATLAVLVCGLAATGSKISVAAFAVASIVHLLRSRSLRPAIRVALLLGCVGMGSIGLHLVSGYIDSYRSDDGLGTLTGRTDLWQSVVVLIAANPVFGYGLNSFEHLQPSNFAWLHAHNEVLQQWVTLGIVGVLLSCLIYRRAFQEAREKNSPSAVLVALILIFSIVRGLTDPEVWGLVFPLPMALMFTYCSAP